MTVPRREKHLYRDGAEGAEEREFDQRYGARGPDVYGRVINKVSREQAAKRKGRKKRERVRAHESTSSSGKRFRVRAHEEEISADPEDDRPRSRGSSHEVEAHEREVDGRREHVREHRAKNPRRRR